MLSEGSDTEDIHTFTINEHYAKAYEYRKEREELARLKEEYGSDADESDVGSEEDSEDAESEDEDGEELTPAMDAAILRTLARIKKKDPSIYEREKNVFEEERHKTGEGKLSVPARKEKSKPLTMRQHVLASALNPESRTPSPEPLTHHEEQAALRDETIAAFHTAVDEDGDDDDLLVPREKTKDEIEREKEEYRAFLEREVGEDLGHIVTVDNDDESVLIAIEEASESFPKKKKKGEGKGKKNKQEEDQEFLMNYILNRGWIDRSARRLPTYDEITSSKKRKGKGKAEDASAPASGDEEEEDEASADEQGSDLDEDENEFDDVVDRFESSYNFRFEEPGAATIARYPRNPSSLVRRQDTSRKDAREKRKGRKDEELLKKKEEIKRLKALKMKELRVKLERIGREGGKSLEETAALQILDLDADWDPDSHDQQMAQLYANDDDGDAIDEVKPQWDDDIDIDDIVPPEPSESKLKKKKKKDKNMNEMDDGVDVDEMDAEVERFRQELDEEEWDGTEEMRKRKLDEYMDQLSELEFNDMIGDMPIRFRYTKVEPQSFALSPTEILMATDAELNSYIGVKKIAPYRKEGKGKHWDVNRTARLKELKEKLKGRGLHTQGQDGKSVDEKVKKRKGKKERLRERAAASAEAADAAVNGDVEEDTAKKMSQKRKRNATEVLEEAVLCQVAHQDIEQEHNGSKEKKRRRHRKQSAAS